MNNPAPSNLEQQMNSMKIQRLEVSLYPFILILLLLTNLLYQRIPPEELSQVSINSPQVIQVLPNQKTKSKEPPKSVKDPVLDNKVTQIVLCHVKNYQNFKEAEAGSNKEVMRVMLFQAKETQKALQKLIPNKEIEDYVEGWNPWNQAKSSFPQKKSPKGKNKAKSSLSMRNRSSKPDQYNNPAKWDALFKLAKTLEKGYSRMTE